MPGPVPGIHVILYRARASKAWMARSSPGRDEGKAPFQTKMHFLFGDPALAHSSFTIPH